MHVQANPKKLQFIGKQAKQQVCPTIDQWIPVPEKQESPSNREKKMDG
jgi:hypothetical protein